MRRDKDLPGAGRGTSSKPTNRFEKSSVEADPEFLEMMKDEPQASPKTQLLTDHSKSIITQNNSPDIAFTYSLNPYRGCEHGCVYCYARPTHEYLGYSAGLDFETKILVKRNAAELLKKHFTSKKWVPEVVTMSGVTDCYQPIERQLQITRSCLQVFLKFRNPVALITKNYLVTRDIDILSELAKFNAVMVNVSITSLDPQLINKMEPRTSRPAARLKAIEKLSLAGVPVRVMAAPLILGLTSHELPSILKAAAEAGATYAGYTPVRLPYGVKDLFAEWMSVNFPEKKEKVLSQIKSIRGGKLNDSEFGSRMKGEGVFSENLAQMFEVFTRKYNLNTGDLELSTEHFVRPNQKNAQLNLFS